MEKTLLEEFIIKKYKNYLEPERKGTPKGDPIGFSRNKYEASLYMLFDLKQKDLAKNLNISYGLLRKWNTEKAFKSIIKGHCIEYAQHVLTYLREKVNTELQQYDELLQKPIDEIAAYTQPHWDFKEFGDYKIYNPILKVMIAIFFSDTAEKVVPENDLPFMSTLLAVIGAFRHFSGIKMPESLKEAENKALKSLEKTLLQRVKDILLKKTITEKDKKQAVFLLSIMERTKK